MKRVKLGEIGEVSRLTVGGGGLGGVWGPTTREEAIATVKAAVDAGIDLLDAALIAHRYALAMKGIDTLILGVKNRRELEQGLAAEAAGPLESDRIAEIDGLRLRE